MESIKSFWEDLAPVPKMCIYIVSAIVFCVIVYFIYQKSKFTGLLVNNNLTGMQPMSASPLAQRVGKMPPLSDPDVPEEIGLAIKYPQGVGVGMDKSDSNSFQPGNPGPLLTNYTVPESYGASSLTDPDGVKGADKGARVIRMTNKGHPLIFKPRDEADSKVYAAAYSSGEVTEGYSFMPGVDKMNYSDDFNPENNLVIQTSPGQESGGRSECEKTYPNVVKYGEFCITAGDIPYGKVVDGKVNPRLVSRWESYTGNYSTRDALENIDGLLYPALATL